MRVKEHIKRGEILVSAVLLVKSAVSCSAFVEKGVCPRNIAIEEGKLFLGNGNLEARVNGFITEILMCQSKAGFP